MSEHMTEQEYSRLLNELSDAIYHRVIGQTIPEAVIAAGWLSPEQVATRIAEAWDEGHDLGCDGFCDHYGEGHVNPYRTGGES